MTTVFEEHAAFSHLLHSVVSHDYDLTEDEFHVLKGCEHDAKRRGAMGAGVSCIASQLIFSRNPFRPASLGLTLIGALVGGYAAGISSVRPCLERICNLEESILALEARRMLSLHATTRCACHANRTSVACNEALAWSTENYVSHSAPRTAKIADSLHLERACSQLVAHKISDRAASPSASEGENLVGRVPATRRSCRCERAGRRAVRRCCLCTARSGALSSTLFFSITQEENMLTDAEGSMPTACCAHPVRAHLNDAKTKITPAQFMGCLRLSRGAMLLPVQLRSSGFLTSLPLIRRHSGLSSEETD